MKKFLLPILWLLWLSGNAQFIGVVSTASDLDYVTTQQSVLYDFSIENATPTRVNFKSRQSVTGLTAAGFVISGKTISSVTVDAGGKSGYFTVSAAFDFWDNVTIRLGENNDVIDHQAKLHNFTLEYVQNNITEPTALNYRYVSASAGGSGDGLTEGNPWTMTQAVAGAAAGMTIFVKAGNYTGYANLTFQKKGTAGSPIKFIGYKNTINDITTNYYDKGVTFSTAEMPTFTGAAINSGYLWYIRECEYIIFKNFQLTNILTAVAGYPNLADNLQSHHLVFERFNGYNLGTTSYGALFELSNRRSDAQGIHQGWTYVRVKNSRGDENSGVWISLRGDGFGLVQDCKFYNSRTTSPNFIDYFIAVSGHNNILRRNYLVNDADVSASMHGIGIRGGNRLSNNYNLVADNSSHGTKEGVYVRNYGCNYNVLKRNYVNSDGMTLGGESYGGLYVWGGCDFNIFEQNYIQGVSVGIGWKNNNDDNLAYTTIGTGNIIRNNIFKNIKWFHYISTTIANTTIGENYLYNNTLYNVDYLNRDTAPVTGGTIIHTNNIFHLVDYSQHPSTLDGYANVSYTNNNFFASGTWVNSIVGTNGNTGGDPNFVDTVFFEPQTEIYAAPLFGVEYDYNGTERKASTSVGAYMNALEGLKPEYIVNGTFDNLGSIWSFNTAWSESLGRGVSDGITQAGLFIDILKPALVYGDQIRVEFDIISNSANNGANTIYLGTKTINTSYLPAGHYVFDATHTVGTSKIGIYSRVGSVTEIDNFSIRKIN